MPGERGCPEAQKHPHLLTLSRSLCILEIKSNSYSGPGKSLHTSPLCLGRVRAHFTKGARPMGLRLWFQARWLSCYQALFNPVIPWLLPGQVP